MASDHPAPRCPPVGRVERGVGWLILCLLAVIAGWMGTRHLHVRNPALQSPAAEAPTSGLVMPWEPLPAALAAMGPAESFDAATLSDKINGKAELYLTAGFVGLTTQRFTGGTAGAPWLELFCYDMRDARAAYAVYSAQRRPDGRRLNVPGEGYQSGTGLFVTRGDRYVEVIASDAVLLPVLETWVSAFVPLWPAVDGTAKADERWCFPPELLVADSVGLIAANAFGFERFSGVMTARLRVASGGDVLAFVMQCATAAQAREDADAYIAFLLANGGKRQAPPTPDLPGAVAVDLFGYLEVVFAQGKIVAGIHEGADSAVAWEAARGLAARMAEGASP